MDIYYKWQLSFNKLTCEWLDLKSCPTVEAGTGEWTHEENHTFCIFIFHSATANDSTEPTILDAFNYPNIPPKDYCPSLRYRRMRSVKTNTYSSEPIVLDIVEEKGDGWWRQVTPFEFEILQDQPLHCADKQLGPNLANTILKYDTEENYRVFEIWWQCIDNELEFIQGPIYKGNVSEAGDESWVWNGEIHTSDLLGTYFILRWTSSTPGYGTAPVTTIDANLKELLISKCTEEDEEEFIELNNIIDEGTTTFNSTTSGFATYRILYNCELGTFENPTVIGLSNPEDASLRNVDQWVYFDTFEDNGIAKCVFYYVAMDSIKDISELRQIQELEIPSIDNISTVNCPCSNLISNVDNVNSINELDFVISGVFGESSSVNRKYILFKEPTTSIWLSEESDVNIRVEYFEELETFSVIANIIYNGNFNFTINQIISSEQVFISDTLVSFSDSVEFVDGDGKGTCSANLEGFTPLGEEIDQSSSSSESSSSSDISDSSTSSLSSDFQEFSSSSSG